MTEKLPPGSPTTRRFVRWPRARPRNRASSTRTGCVRCASTPVHDVAFASVDNPDLASGRIWVVAHKPVAVASGLGVMGIHRNVIHPKFGNFILLGTVIVATLDNQLR